MAMYTVLFRDLKDPELKIPHSYTCEAVDCSEARAFCLSDNLPVLIKLLTVVQTEDPEEALNEYYSNY